MKLKHTVDSRVSETKKCRISSSSKGLLSVREVRSRWTEGCECDSVNKANTDSGHQTNTLCYLLPSLNLMLLDFPGLPVLCH